MIPRGCRRLVEVDFPIATVSSHSAAEKKVFAGHPSMINQWWARRPLAACRAILLGLLLPDPCDPLCPPEFKSAAGRLLSSVPGTVGASDLDLRRALTDFIGDFASWDLAVHPTYLEVARGLVRAAWPEEPPIIVDPFAGGGSIPFEALRLGCEVFASDLNPVSCLILEVLLEHIPRHGSTLTAQLSRLGEEVRAQAEKELAQFFPPDPDGAQPIAYLWARTVRCEAPSCGAEIPLVRSFWLSKKGQRRRALRYSIVRDADPLKLEFEVFEPRSDDEVPAGTVSRAKARCPVCGTVVPPERVRIQLAAQKGGADAIFDSTGRHVGGARLLAVVTVRPGEEGRCYRLPVARDYEPILKATRALEGLARQSVADGIPSLPEEPLPPVGTLGFRVQRYGILRWGDLFTARQKLVLLTLTRKVCDLRDAGGAESAAKVLLAFLNNRLADKNASLNSWQSEHETVGHVFNRQALPMVWDFVEVAPFADATGSYRSALEELLRVVERWGASVSHTGQVQIADACDLPLPDQSSDVWFTDPPYYDAVPYAHLSDFFFVWLKRALPGHPLLRDPFDPANPLTPKAREIVQDEVQRFEGRPKDKHFFEQRIAQAFATGRRVLRQNGIGCVVFAHKTTEGWEAMLSGILKAGWTIVASWPVRTERPNRLRAQESAALVTSVHLVCRPRAQDAGVGDWTEIKAEMDRRVTQWMQRLLEEGIRGADAIFSCIGPALEVFSRYDRVETAAGYMVPLGGDPEASEPEERGFLAYVFEAVSREALRQVLGDAETEGFEEDARLVALFLWTLQTTTVNGNNSRRQIRLGVAEQEEGASEEENPAKKRGGLALPFDTFIRITRPMGIHYQNWVGRIVEIEKDVVRLIPVRDRKEQLLGADDTEYFIPREVQDRQLTFFDAHVQPMRVARGGISAGRVLKNPTTLDRVHRAMLLFGNGQTSTLRAVLEEERRRGNRFERLALALTALYPEKSQERRWLEGVQAMIKR